MGFGEPMDDGVFITDSSKDVFERMCILFPIRKLDVMIGEYGVNFVRHSSDKIAPELCRTVLMASVCSSAYANFDVRSMATNTYNLPSSVRTSAISMWK